MNGTRNQNLQKDGFKLLKDQFCKEFLTLENNYNSLKGYENHFLRKRYGIKTTQKILEEE